MSRPLSLVVVAALLLSGVAIGALGMHLYYWDKLATHGMGPPPVTPWMIGWMERELDLSAEQRLKIERILADSRRRGGEMRRELKPRVEALMRDTSERIAEVLTDEQRQRFETLQGRQRHRFERGFLGPPEGPPHRRRPARPPREDL